MATDPLQNSTMTIESKDLSKLHKFLCYGSENDCYSSGSNKEVNLDDAQCILRLTENGHGEEVVKEICAFSQDGFSVRQDPLTFGLAVCAKLSKDLKTKRAALKAVIAVCPTAAQLFRFVEYTEKLSGETSGWGRGQRKAVSEWYNRKESGPLAVAVTKYIQRNGWSHLDIIRLAHIKPERDALAVCLTYVVKGLEATKKQHGSDCPSAEVTSVLAYLEAVDTVKHSTDAQLAARLTEQFQLSREHIPTHYVNSKEVWRALLQNMPLAELMESLSKLTSLGLVDAAGKHSEAPLVIDRLKNDTLIKDSRIQPFQALLALKMYELGKVEKGKLKCVPNASILEALTTAFHSSFKNIPPTNKRYLIAVDVDRLLKSPVIGSNFLLPAVAAAAMTMTIARTEQQYQLVVGSEKINSTELTAEMYLNEIIEAVSQASGKRKRNCANPIIWATENKKTVDVFLIFTDGDTTEFSVHPREALKKYREELNIPDARLVMCGLTDGKMSIADSGDSGMLDIIGFDVGAPQVIHNFVTEKL